MKKTIVKESPEFDHVTIVFYAKMDAGMAQAIHSPYYAI